MVNWGLHATVWDSTTLPTTSRRPSYARFVSPLNLVCQTNNRSCWKARVEATFWPSYLLTFSWHILRTPLNHCSKLRLQAQAPAGQRWRYYYLLHGLHNASPLSIMMSTSSRRKLWPVQGTPSGTSSDNWVLAAPTSTRVCMSPIVIAVTRALFTTSIHAVSSNLLS